MMTFDNAEELKKIMTIHPTAEYEKGKFARGKFKFIG